MRKNIYLFLVSILLITPIYDARSDIPPKAKAFLTITGYGAGGGALLGVASLAFGASPRAIAQGASLGLYAGILFGTYVLLTHGSNKTQYYDDSASPYQEGSDIYGDDYAPQNGGTTTVPPSSKRGGFFDRIQGLNYHLENGGLGSLSDRKKGGNLPPLSLNIINYQF